jgi:hypothetical protein
MSNSVVPAGVAAHAKQLVRNTKLVKRTEEKQPAHHEQQAADKDADAVHAIQTQEAEHVQSSMSDVSLSTDFSFSGALSDAAADSASLISAETSADDEGGSTGDDGDGAGGTILLVGAVGLAGLGVAVLAGGGGHKNEAPDITSASTATIAENAPITTAVYTTVATDPDGDALTYSLSGTDAAAFAISSTGVVTLKAPADFEAKSSYSFTVTASDGELSDTQAVTVTVGNVTGANGDKPAFTSGTTASIAENSATTTTVYDANVTGTGATFALTGTDAGAFNIDAATGVVTFKNSPDFEAKASYAIGVVATQDGGTNTQNVTVSVTNVNEAPTFDSGSTATTPENVPTTTVIYDAHVTGTAPTTFAVTGTDAAAFTIDSDDGELRFVQSPNFEAKAAYDVTVTASSGGETTSQAVHITVTDVAVEGPAFTSGTSVDIPENSPTSTTVYDADATGSGQVTFALTGADAGAFDINTSNGIVTFKESPDFETKAEYAITVTATDGNGTSSQAVAVHVTDVDPEGPVVTEKVIDLNGTAQTVVTLDDASAGATTFLDDFAVGQNVVLTGFGDDDIIKVSNITDLNQYSFTTGSGGAGQPDSNDLVITFNNGAGLFERIVIQDIIDTSVPGFFNTYEGAVTHTGGQEFMTIA